MQVRNKEVERWFEMSLWKKLKELFAGPDLSESQVKVEIEKSEPENVKVADEKSTPYFEHDEAAIKSLENGGVEDGSKP